MVPCSRTGRAASTRTTASSTGPRWPIIQQAFAGAAQQADRVQPRDPKKAERPTERFKRDGDSADLPVTEVEAAEAIRDAKGNDQEEAHEDRQQQGLYEQRGKKPEDRPRIDVEG